MLTYCRPKGSVTEEQFIQEYIANLPGATMDRFQNWHVQIGTAPVLWSCHTDSVHWYPGRQDVKLKDGYITLATKKTKQMGRWMRADCLGADDAAGVFIMREMILAGVPGSYIFHFGEEVGGLGSSDLAHNRVNWLMQFNYAIAFDRRGTTDIITYQSGGRCASDAFAQGFADQLNAMNSSFRYAPSDWGVYTDTAEYRDLIPECTNVSVGYAREHSSDESLDVKHILNLVESMKRLDVSALPVKRDPTVEEDPYIIIDKDDQDFFGLRPTTTRAKTTRKKSTRGTKRLTNMRRVLEESWSLDPEYDEIQRILTKEDSARKRRVN